MIITNDNHMIIKNHYGKKPMAFKISQNFYGKKCLFVHSEIIYSGKCTSHNNFILSFLQNEGGFHGVIFGKRTISKWYNW